MSRLPEHLGQAFLTAERELGMAGAARLFVRELAALDGDELVADTCDSYGREYPVLDFVAHRWLRGDQKLRRELDQVSRALEGIKRLLVVRLETDELAGLVQTLPNMDAMCRVFSVFDGSNIWPIGASVDGARGCA